MIGLIVGDTSLPKFVINKLVQKKINFLILDLTEKNIYKKYSNCNKLKITELGKALSILKKNNCKKGTVKKAPQPYILNNDFHLK